MKHPETKWRPVYFVVSPILGEKWACAILIHQGDEQKPKILIRNSLPFTWGGVITSAMAIFQKDTADRIESFYALPSFFGPQFVLGKVQTFRFENAEEKLDTLLNPKWIGKEDET